MTKKWTSLKKIAMTWSPAISTWSPTLTVIFYVDSLCHILKSGCLAPKSLSGCSRSDQDLSSFAPAAEICDENYDGDGDGDDDDDDDAYEATVLNSAGPSSSAPFVATSVPVATSAAASGSASVAAVAPKGVPEKYILCSFCENFIPGDEKAMLVFSQKEGCEYPACNNNKHRRLKNGRKTKLAVYPETDPKKWGPMSCTKCGEECLNSNRILMHDLTYYCLQCAKIEGFSPSTCPEAIPFEPLTMEETTAILPQPADPSYVDLVGNKRDIMHK